MAFASGTKCDGLTAPNSGRPGFPARNQEAVRRAVAESNDYAAKNQFIEAYETLALLPDAQQPLVADQLAALQKSYIPAAFHKAQKLQEIHIPIRGRADEDVWAVDGAGNQAIAGNIRRVQFLRLGAVVDASARLVARM